MGGTTTEAEGLTVVSMTGDGLLLAEEQTDVVALKVPALVVGLLALPGPAFKLLKPAKGLPLRGTRYQLAGGSPRHSPTVTPIRFVSRVSVPTSQFLHSPFQPFALIKLK